MRRSDLLFQKHFCSWISGEGRSASRLCELAWSLVLLGKQLGQSQHDRDGHAPFFCGAKSNFKKTMVLFLADYTKQRTLRE
jgi:hypothetical protein